MSSTNNRSGYRGYIASRPVRGTHTPQRVQNLVVRDYAARTKLDYRLSAVEYAMPACYMMLDDVLGDGASGKAGDLQQAMRMIGEAERGVVVLIREPSADALSTSLQSRLDGEPKAGGQLRDYGVGAQILLDLGVRDMILLSNTKRTIVGLEGYGLRVVGQRTIEPLGKA